MFESFLNDIIDTAISRTWAFRTHESTTFKLFRVLKSINDRLENSFESWIVFDRFCIDLEGTFTSKPLWKLCQNRHRIFIEFWMALGRLAQHSWGGQALEEIIRIGEFLRTGLEEQRYPHSLAWRRSVQHLLLHLASMLLCPITCLMTWTKGIWWYAPYWVLLSGFLRSREAY